MLGTIAVCAGLGVAYRLRGHRPEGGLLRRLMHPVFFLRPMWFCAVFAAVHFGLGQPVDVAVVVAAGEWVGLHLRHSPGQDMGTYAGTEGGDVLAMAGVGLARGTLVALPLLAFGHVPPVDAVMLPVLYAATLPASYWVGWRVPWRVPHLLRGGIEWSELLTGLTRGAVLASIFLPIG